MAKKKTGETVNTNVPPSSSPPPTSPDKPPGPLSVVISPEERFPVKVNNASVTELKIACDDAVKRV